MSKKPAQIGEYEKKTIALITQEREEQKTAAFDLAMSQKGVARVAVFMAWTPPGKFKVKHIANTLQVSQQTVRKAFKCLPVYPIGEGWFIYSKADEQPAQIEDEAQSEEPEHSDDDTDSDNLPDEGQLDDEYSEIKENNWWMWE